MYNSLRNETGFGENFFVDKSYYVCIIVYNNPRILFPGKEFIIC